MGRRNIMRISSADVNVAGYANLVDKIKKFEAAEEDFYNSRKNALQDYPGFSGKTADQIEKEYDKQYGSDPWNYSSRAGTSSDERTETDATTDDDGDDVDRFYVKIPNDGENNPTPIDGISAPSVSDDYSQTFLLYNPGVGVLDVDVTYENISFFQKGQSGFFDGAGRGLNFQPYFTGFNEVPIFYNANSNYSGKQLHMFKKLGAIYDAAVGPAYSAYQSAKTTYDDNNKSSNITTPILRTTFDFAWDGTQGDKNAGYNRVDKLKNKLIKEAMGFN